MEQRVADLEREVTFLRQEIVRLTGELVLLSRNSADHSDRQSSVASVLDSPLRPPGSSTAYSLVSEPAANSNRSPGTVPDPQSWPDRERICEQIGVWLARGLVGDHRGASGRDRLHLSSRVWIVARDFVGQDYNPIVVCNSFHACKILVKRGESCGESLFIGLPSKREAKIVASVAGLEWPDAA